MRAQSSGKMTVKKCRLPVPSETETTKAILELLAIHKIFAWRANTGGAAYPDGKGGFRHVRYGFGGVADLIGIMPLSHGLAPGRFLAIEVKYPGKRPTADQQAFLDAVNAHGGIGFVATSVEEVKEKLGL